MRNSKLLFVLFFLFFFIVGSFYVKKFPPRGDEIHYLLTSVSLVKDWDFNVKNNYDNGDYQKYYGGNLKRHSVTPRLGEEYMYLGVGLHPILLAIPYIFLDRLGSTLAVSLAAGIL